MTAVYAVRTRCKGRSSLSRNGTRRAGGRRGGEGRGGLDSVRLWDVQAAIHTPVRTVLVSNCACETARAQQDGMAQERNGRRSNTAPFPARAQHTRLFDIGAQSHRLFFESADESPIVLDQALLLVQLPHDIILGQHPQRSAFSTGARPYSLSSRAAPTYCARSRLGPTPSPPTTEATLPLRAHRGHREPTPTPNARGLCAVPPLGTKRYGCAPRAAQRQAHLDDRQRRSG